MRLFVSVCGALLSMTISAAAQVPTLPYDHVHLNVPDVAGLFKLGFVEDPWGTRIEVVQDPDLFGLHHIHMRAPDPDAAFEWLLAKFGGEKTKLKGRIDAVKYSAPGFSDMWILMQKGDAAASEGHAIDHIGWRAKDLDAKIAELKTMSVKV